MIYLSFLNEQPINKKKKCKLYKYYMSVCLIIRGLGKFEMSLGQKRVVGNFFRSMRRICGEERDISISSSCHARSSLPNCFWIVTFLFWVNGSSLFNFQREIEREQPSNLKIEKKKKKSIPYKLDDDLYLELKYIYIFFCSTFIK